MVVPVPFIARQDLCDLISGARAAERPGPKSIPNSTAAVEREHTLTMRRTRGLTQQSRTLNVALHPGKHRSDTGSVCCVLDKTPPPLALFVIGLVLVALAAMGFMEQAVSVAFATLGVGLIVLAVLRFVRADSQSNWLSRRRASSTRTPSRWNPKLTQRPRPASKKQPNGSGPKLNDCAKRQTNFGQQPSSCRAN